MRKGLKITGIMMLLLVMVFQWAWAEAPKPETIAGKLSKFNAKKEVTALRTEYSRSYQEKGGKRTLFLASEPLNYQGDDGKFYPIDTYLVSASSSAKDKSSSSKKYRHQALKNVLRARFGDNSDEGILLEHGAYPIQFSIRHKYRRTAVINKNKIRYPKVFDNADLQYTVEAGKVKDELIFSSAPASSILNFKVDFGKLKPKKSKNGAIELVDEEGKMIFTIAPSIMYEQGNKEAGRKIATRFHWEKDQLYCDLILDMGWLKNPRRKYPVVIDPSAAIYSYGTSWKRVYLRTPEANGALDFSVDIDGPGWHGHLYHNNKAQCYFKDLTTGSVFFQDSSYDSISRSNLATQAQAGHEYEVGIYAGASYAKVFWEDDHIGSGWATLVLDSPIFADQTIQGKNEFFTSITGSSTFAGFDKEFTVNYPQTISFSNINNLRLYKDEVQQALVGTKVNVYPGFQYRFNVWGTIANSISVDFPYLTRNYESKIVMGTQPRCIESIIKVPQDGQLLLKYETTASGWSASEGLPTIDLYSESGQSIYKKTLNLSYYDQIIGGQIIAVEKELPYHLKVTGRAGLTVYFQQNTPGKVSGLNLYDTGGGLAGGFAQGDYGLHFDYQDAENNTLKEYQLTVQKTGEAFIQNFLVQGLQFNGGPVSLPFTIRDLGYSSGDTLLCQITGAWDGFDQSQTAAGFNFTLDTAPPTVAIEDRSLVNTDNTITLYFHSSDLLSQVADQTISWKVNGNMAGSQTVNATATTYQIPNLPANAKVDVTLTATDKVGNQASSTLSYYTYPEKSQLMAPGQILANPNNNFTANLKLAKVNASLYRVQRYKNQISDSNLDYDSGYLDPANLAAVTVGPPNAYIVSPTSNMVFSQPANVTITAEAVDGDGKVEKVEFYADDQLIGSDLRSPYNITWYKATPGSHALTVKATDNDGLTTVSEPVYITVGNDIPRVNITSPADYDSFPIGNTITHTADVTLTAEGFDTDGSIAKIEFYNGSSLIGTATSSPYTVTWNNVQVGSYTVVAKAIDNSGGVGESAPVHIQVVIPPPYVKIAHVSFTISRGLGFYVYKFAITVYADAPYGNGIQRVVLVEPFSGTLNYSNSYYNFSYSGRISSSKSKPFTVVAYDNFGNTAMDSVTLSASGEYDFPTLSPSVSATSKSPLSVRSSSELERLVNTGTIQTFELQNLSSLQTDETGSDATCYQLQDQKPIQPHQTYIYRIWTKNGDKEVFQDSTSIPVLNNAPAITGSDPAADSLTYSNGTVTLNVAAEDYDGDSGLTYTYTLTPVNSTTPYRNETGNNSMTWTSVPDGQYIWSVSVKDTYGGETKTNGTVIVDKNVPVAKFTMNNNNPITNNQTVQVRVSDTSNVSKIQLSNSGDFVTYQEFSDWSSPISWDLTSGDGSKIVYLRAVSVSGVTSTIQRQIFLDTAPPDTANLSIKAKGGDGQVSFSWSGGSDGEGSSGSGVAGANIQIFEDGAWQSYAADYQNNFLTIGGLGYDVETRIRIQLADQVGNLSGWVVGPYAYSKAQAGSIDMAGSSSGYSDANGHYIAIKIDPVSGARQYYKILCTENPGGGYSGEITDPSVPYINGGLISHAEYKYVVLTYNENYEITESEEYTFTIANAAPSKPVASGPKGIINQNAGVRFSFGQEPSDADNDNLKITYHYKAEGAGQYTSQSSAILPALGDGNYSWYATIDDQNGAVVETEPVAFAIDNGKPEIVIDNTSGDWASAHQVKIEAGDSGSGLATLEYRVNGGSYIPTASGSQVTLDSQGANSLEVKATDKAGNTTSFQHLYFVDRTGPALSGFQWNLSEAAGKSLANTDQIPAQWNADDPETGISQFKYAWSTHGSYDPNAMQTLTLNGALGTYTNIFQGDFQDGQTYYLIIQALNSLGQASETLISPPLLYDHTAPLIKLNGIGGGQSFSGQYYLKDLSQLTVSFEASDPDTQINKVEYAFVQKTEDETITWYPSLAELAGNAISPNTPYYLAVKATNGTGLSGIVYSQPVILVNISPEVSIESSTVQYDTTSYNAVVKTSDSATMVTKLEYAIGSTPGGSDLSANLPGAGGGWFSVTHPPQTLEIHQYANIPLGTVYYLTVKATNVAGLAATRTSAGTTVTRPVNAPVVKDGGIYTSSRNQLYFSWEFNNAAQSITNYQYRIKTDQALLVGWTTYEADGPVHLTVSELNLANNTQYYCEVRAQFADGSYSDSGISDGITTDFTAPVLDSFTAPAYCGGEGILLNWAARDMESGINSYLGLGTSPGQTDVTKGWVPVGSLKSYQINQDANGAAIPFMNGAKYYATLLIENGAGLTIEKTSPAIISDLTPPPTPIVLDEGRYTNRNDVLKASWKWTAADNESGIKEYQYTITNQRSLDGGEIWFSNGTVKEAAIAQLTIEGQTINVSLTNGKVYYIAVKAVNNAGAESVGFSDGILVDIQAPDPPTVVDFGDYSLSANSLRASMVSSDAQTGVAGYKLSLGHLKSDGTIDPGSMIKDRDVLSPSGGSGDFNADNLSLQEGQIYFFTITALDNAGNISMESMSDGIMVDSKQPQITKVAIPGRYVADSTGFSFDWELTATPSGVAGIRYAIGDNPNGTGLTWQEANLIGSQKVNGLNLKDGGTYYIYLKAQSIAARETSDSWSAPICSDPITIDTTSPEVISITTPADGRNSRHFLLQWEARDTGSGITDYRYAIGSIRGGTDVTGGWVNIRSNQNNVSFYRDDLPLSQSSQYFISVMAKNGAGLWSEVYQSNAIVVDLTPPVVSKPEYGSSYLRSKTAINGIHWEAGDPESGISAIKIQPVLVKDGKPLEVAPILTHMTADTVNLANLSLLEGQLYYLAIQAENGVGDWSAVSYSQAITVDTIPPVASFPDAPAEYVTNDGKLAVPYQVSEPGTVMLQLIAADGRTETSTVSVEKTALYDFAETEEGTYTLLLRPRDQAGNPETTDGIPVVTASRKIRLNAKPVAVIGPDLVITKGTTVHFHPEVSDSDGQVTQYQWDFGNGETSTEAAPSCTYKEVADYTVTLVVTDNDGKSSEVARRTIKVTNTNSGELTMDENWYGVMEISGDIIVPQGKALTIMAGTQVVFTGNYQIKVFGKLVIDGTASEPVTVGDTHTAWNGIRLEKCDPGSRISYATITGASAGVVVDQSQVAINGVIFQNNNIGLHILASNPTVQNSSFLENSIYGVKEDDNAAPKVINCRFSGNKVADYYEDRQAIINMDVLNRMNGNSGNLAQ